MLCRRHPSTYRIWLCRHRKIEVGDYRQCAPALLYYLRPVSKVWAHNEETGESDWYRLWHPCFALLPIIHIGKEVTKTWVVEDEQIYKVIINAANSAVENIEATSSHPFYVVDKGWVNTVDLVQGDTLIDFRQHAPALLYYRLPWRQDQGLLTVVAVVDQLRKDTGYTEN